MVVLYNLMSGLGPTLIEYIGLHEFEALKLSPFLYETAFIAISWETR